MSDLKVDGIIASTGTNTALTLQGKGSGKVDIGDGALSFPDADGDADQVIKTDGSGALSFVTPAAGGFTLGTEQATTSGTTKTFTGIPAGTTMIVIMFEEVSYSGTVTTLVTIGDSGGLETTGYVSQATGINQSVHADTASTSAFEIEAITVSNLMTGTMTLTLKDSSNFTWVSNHLVKTATDEKGFGSGVKSLSAELTQLHIAGGTFDAGSINIMYQ